MKTRRWITMAAAVLIGVMAHSAAAQSGKTMYDDALARDRALRDAARRGEDPTLKQVREAIAAYEAIVRRHPSSGYADNALYQGAMLAVDAYHRLVDPRDRRTAVRLLKQLVARYPTSRLVANARTHLTDLEPALASAPSTPKLTSRVTGGGGQPTREAPAGNAAVAPPLPASAPFTIPSAAPPAPAAPAPMMPALRTDGPPPAPGSLAPTVVIRDIRRITLPEVVRVLIELDGEVAFREERVENPARMFVDLKGTRVKAPLVDAVLTFTDDAVKQIRVGRHPQNTTRVVVDLNDVTRYTVFTLYNPFRIVIDCERRPGFQPRPAASTFEQPAASNPAEPPAAAVAPASADNAKPETPAPLPSVRRGPRAAAAPGPPSTNLQGGFSLSRQLGLGVARIVIDPGHGGHDPGALGPAGVIESALVLDVALRLEKLLLREPGMDVVLTRHTDEFIPLEERTAIANRENADLFLSIHANASRNNSARGIETYFLNFASNPDAEAVAARENMTTGRTMNSLPDIVKAIALNNKLDESRDFATIVQQSMVQRLKAPNKTLRDLGVKQAPFVVLIGAAMPSVLAEISFVTNRQEASLLKSGPYRQKIAEALLTAIVRYQRSLKSARTIAKREAQEK